MSRDVSVFDDRNLINVKLYLNSEFYPYGDLNVDIGKNKYAIFYLICIHVFIKLITDTTATKRCLLWPHF